MEYKSEVFENQYHLVKRFVYHLVYYRALLNEYRISKLQDEFWTLTIDADLLRATINWCMVFGSDKSNPTHWKMLSATDSEKLLRSFRTGLLKKTGLSSLELRRYWKSVVDFRNKYAAHHDWKFKEPIPHFDIALAVAFYYDEWIRKIISPVIFDEPPLRQFADSLGRSIAPLAKEVLRVTKCRE